MKKVISQKFIWGDYGTVLISGFSSRDNSDQSMLLHRTGPFVPPISFPYDSLEGRRILVTDTFRLELESSGFPGFAFRRAKKNNIIRVNWHTWDLAAPLPDVMPKNGEPFNYFDNLVHNPSLAAGMPELYEFLPPVVSTLVLPVEDPQGGYLDAFRADFDKIACPPVFSSGDTWGKLVVDSQGWEFFKSKVCDWIEFSDIE